jgi:hypothetical protein
MPTQCEMIVGYLVPHRCEKKALGHCMKCGRSFCDEHIDVQPTGLLCLACQQGLAQPVALPITARNFSEADLALFTAASLSDVDDTDKFADLS